MSRPARHDVAVVGGGVVGTACALALTELGLDVTLLEAVEPAHWSPQQRDLRVYALALDNVALLTRLGVWDVVRATRAQRYRRMRVWDAADARELSFDADALGRAELGWIVEHALLVDALWRRLAAVGVEVHCPTQVTAVTQDAAGVRLDLADGGRIDARLIVAADGAKSALRDMLGIDTQSHDYQQRAVVCYVRAEYSHQDTAWQRFLPGGPLALLPFARNGVDEQVAAQPDRDCSIVWTLPVAEAQRITALDDAAFARELSLASDLRLGALQATSARAAFALRRQLAARYVQGRALLIGDAAHVVHPLAGQGVNLGLRDVAALARVVAAAQTRRTDFATAARLARWARERRSENTIAAHTFDAINRLYSNDAMLPTLLRGRLLGFANALPPVTDTLWRRAGGL